jgi:mannose-6-phosphate isomerase-like protein (cupin superfamily)
MIDKVNLAEKFALFSDTWSPKIVGEVNEFSVKLAKLSGEFVWHFHEHEDEMFLVISGSLNMQFRDRSVTVNPGEFIIVPAGVEHNPLAETETQIVLFERSTTAHTGNVKTERTVRNFQRL